MNIIYADQSPTQIRQSIFLAGPTPRHRAVASWRPTALAIFKEASFQGTLLVPERQNWDISFDYLHQVEWEFWGLENADVLLFWVPRDTEKLPAFTTNVEFGRYVGSGRMIYGRPDGCPHNQYLDWLYQRTTGALPLRWPTRSIARSLAWAVQCHRLTAAKH